MYCVEYKTLSGEVKRTEPIDDYLAALRLQGEMVKGNFKKTRKKKNLPESLDCHYSLIQVVRV